MEHNQIHYILHLRQQGIDLEVQMEIQVGMQDLMHLIQATYNHLLLMVEHMEGVIDVKII
jgi:hypothetical protein